MLTPNEAMVLDMAMFVLAVAIVGLTIRYAIQSYRGGDSKKPDRSKTDKNAKPFRYERK